MSNVIKKALIPLFLTLALLAGCFSRGPGSAAPDSGPQAEQAKEQAKPTAAALALQQEFDALTEDLFLKEAASNLITLHYTLADPAAFGITEYAPTFGTVSLEENQTAARELLSLKLKLDGLDRGLLREDQLLTCRILDSYLSAQLSSNGLELYDQPLSSSLGIQAQLPILLCEYAFYGKQDIEDYLALLSSIDSYYAQLLAFEQQKSQAGLGLCDWAIDRIVESCSAYLSDADTGFMAQTFASRLDELGGLTQTEREQYIARNQEALAGHFVPAYQLLSEGLLALKGTGGNDKGLFYLPQGREYYEYLVKSNTGTSYPTVEELQGAVMKQMRLDLAAMDALLKTDPSLAGQMYSYSFSLTEPGAILEDLKKQFAGRFPAIGDCSYTVKNVPKALEPVLSPAFYLTVPIDRPKDNSIYINQGSTSSRKNLYTTLAHEGWPGHMYQTQYFNAKNTCNLRKLLNFSSYTEGWATYVEYLSYGMDNGLSPSLAKLLHRNSAFTLALYALLDIQIHYEGWDMEQTEAFLKQFFQISDASVVTAIYRDIAENPSNYLEYYVGYLEIAQMRREAEKALGNAFKELDFHTFLLDMGPAPFDVIRPYFEGWLAKQQKTPGTGGA